MSSVFINPLSFSPAIDCAARFMHTMNTAISAMLGNIVPRNDFSGASSSPMSYVTFSEAFTVNALGWKLFRASLAVLYCLRELVFSELYQTSILSGAVLPL